MAIPTEVANTTLYYELLNIPKDPAPSQDEIKRVGTRARPGLKIHSLGRLNRCWIETWS